METARAHVLEEVAVATTEQRREEARSVAESIASGAAVVVVREADGAEHSLPAEDVRALLALLTARAEGQKVLVVGHGAQISPQKAAEWLGVSRPLVYRLIERGDLPAERVGTHYRLRVGDVLELADKRAQLAASVDTGFAKAMEMSSVQRHDDTADAKSAWKSATDDQRARAVERVRKRAAHRRARQA